MHVHNTMQFSCTLRCAVEHTPGAKVLLERFVGPLARLTAFVLRYWHHLQSIRSGMRTLSLLPFKPNPIPVLCRFLSCAPALKADYVALKCCTTMCLS
jgi:hypothetical protein